MKNLKSRKYKVIEKIMTMNEEAINKLEASIEDILGSGRVSLEKYDEELEKADHRINEGNFLEHSEALKKILSWKEK